MVDPGRAATIASLGAACMIAQQVGSKAARDALFLSSFDITSLPLMLGGAAALTVLGSLLVGRAMIRFGPQRLVPGAFAVSAVLLVLEWLAAPVFPRLIAVLFFLHVAGFGLILISGFWSLLSERFDPRSAKKLLGRVAMSGTVGGLAGGVLAERVGSVMGLGAMLPLLALLTAAAGGCAWALRGGGGPAPDASSEEVSGLKVLATVPYLRNLGILVLLGTVSATFLDYVFKARAVAAISNPAELLRFFAVFYTALAFVTVLVQLGLGRWVLQRWGIVPAVLALPAGVVAGGAVALAWPGLVAAALARGAESVLRSSLYRGGYEALFAPLRRAEKRATKSLIDVGFDRLGDGLGAAMVFGLLALGAAAEQAMLAAAVVLGGAAVLVANQLKQGYVAALERSLVEMKPDTDWMAGLDEQSQQILTVTLRTSELPVFAEYLDSLRVSASALEPVPASQSQEVGALGEQQSKVQRLLGELRSGDVDRVLAAVGTAPLAPGLIPTAVGLLGWDDVAKAMARALIAAGPPAIGPAIAALEDPDEVFAVRRRVPVVLGALPSREGVDALLAGLSAPRFEVRFRCGRALRDALLAEPSLALPAQAVFEQVKDEVARQSKVWSGQRLLDGGGLSPFVTDLLESRADRGLEHVVTLLSLVLETEPLVIAYQALHTQDVMLVGTAFEYLEQVLPDDVRAVLWPFLESDARRPSAPDRSAADVLASLLRDHPSLQNRLADGPIPDALGSVEPGAGEEAD